MQELKDIIWMQLGCFTIPLGEDILLALRAQN